MKKLFFIILSVVSTLSLYSQEKTDKYLNDFEYLTEKLIETHPEPYHAFGGAIAFHRLKQQAAKKIRESKTDEEFVLQVNQFLSHLNDGHTSLYFPNSKKKTSLYLPLLFKIAADGLFVHNTNKKYEELIGSFLLKINNVPVNDFLDGAKNFEPTENISGRYNALSRCILNSSRAERFFGTKKLQLTFQKTDGSEQTVNIPHQQKIEMLPEKSQFNFEEPYCLLFNEMLGENKDVAYFRWNSVLGREAVEDTYKRAPKWVKGKLDWAYVYSKNKPTGDTLQDIKNIPSLYEQFYLLSEKIKKCKGKYIIIDLRYNSGGITPLVYPLLYMFYGNHYLNFDFKADWIRRISPLYLKKVGVNNIEEYYGQIGNKKYSGEYLFETFGNYGGSVNLQQKIKEIEGGYNGFGAEYVKKTKSLRDVEIIVLSSYYTFSAAYHFTYFLKKLGRTTIVGVAPKQASNAYMESTRITLPETKLQASISNSKQLLFEEDSPYAKLLRPDYEMKWEDFKKYDFDVNAEIKKALELIESGK